MFNPFSQKGGKIETPCPKCKSTFRIPDNKVIKFSCPNCKTNLHAINGMVFYRLLDKILDPTNGWEYSSREVPVELMFTEGEVHPYYNLKVNGIKISALQLDQHGASYICCNTELDGLTISNQSTALQDNFNLIGIVSWGIAPNKNPHLQAAFPISEEMNLDTARKQFLVTVGSLVCNAIEIYKEANLSSKGNGFDWELAGNVAGLVGKMLRAFVDG